MDRIGCFVITRTSPLIRHSCLTPGAKRTVVMAAPSELRGSVQKSHRRRRPRQSPQQLPGLAAVKEVARLRRGGRMFVSRLPYQHLIKEVARPLQNKVNIFYTVSNIFCKFAECCAAGVQWRPRHGAGRHRRLPCWHLRGVHQRVSAGQ